jgi:uncharacterized protein YxeA
MKKKLIIILIFFILLLIGIGIFFVFYYNKGKINYIYDPTQDRMIFSVEINMKKEHYQVLETNMFGEKKLVYSIYKKNNNNNEKLEINEYPHLGSGSNRFYPDYCLKNECRKIREQDYLWSGFIGNTCYKTSNDDLFFEWDLKRDHYKKVKCDYGENNCYDGRQRVDPGVYMVEVCFFDECDDTEILKSIDLSRKNCFFEEFTVPKLDNEAQEKGNKLEKLELCKRIYDERGEYDNEILDKASCVCNNSLYCDCRIFDNNEEQVLLIFNTNMNTCLLAESYLFNDLYSVDVWNKTIKNNAPNHLIGYGEFLEAKDFDESCEGLYFYYERDDSEEAQGGCDAFDLRNKMFADVRSLGFDINEKMARLDQDKSSIIKKPLIDDTQIFFNGKFGFQLKYPDYFSKTIGYVNDRLEAISDKSDQLIIEAKKGDLKNYIYKDSASPYSFRFSSSTYFWTPLNPEAPVESAPHKIFMGVASMDENLVFYLAKKTEGEQSGEFAVFQDPDNKYIIEINVFRNNNLDHYSNDRTIYDIIGTIEF